MTDKLIDHDLIDLRIAPAELIAHPLTIDQSEKFRAFLENFAVVNGDIVVAEHDTHTSGNAFVVPLFDPLSAVDRVAPHDIQAVAGHEKFHFLIVE